ncbi:MAG: ribose 5-phosphate isomerase B [bacterium]
MKKKIKVALAADHAGFAVKEKLVEFLEKEGYEFKDLGTYSGESVDYPDFAHLLAKEIEDGRVDFGISVCGSGNGINMALNKHDGIRSALCWQDDIAELARKHNDANVCALPGRFLSFEQANSIVKIFLDTPFDGGRHKQRIDKIPIK